MFGTAGRLTVGVAVWAAAAVLAPAEDSATVAAPQQALLLLRGGEVIEGKISRVGELYYVAVPSGEIRINAASVQFACRDLDEAYRRQRELIQPGNVHDHLRMAQWSLRHGLLGCAARELADAADADPTHPMIALLQRRLKTAMEPPQLAPDLPSGQATPPAEDLDCLVRGMPPGSVETFTQTIQPLLVNRCAAADCHGPGSSSGLRLLRMSVGRPPSRRLTQQNLRAVLAWVDREDPTASRLLTEPTHPHGTADRPIFSAGQTSQYRQLVDWVCRLSPGPTSRMPETTTSKEEPPVRALAPDALAPETIPPNDPAGADVQPAGLLAADPQNSSVRGPSVKRGAPLPLFVPVDPFDPEIFNRRYFGHAEPPSQLHAAQ